MYQGLTQTGTEMKCSNGEVVHLGAEPSGGVCEDSGSDSCLLPAV